MTKTIHNWAMLSFIVFLFLWGQLPVVQWYRAPCKPEQAYRLVIEDFLGDFHGKYLAVVMGKNNIDPREFIDVLQGYCDEHGITLLLDYNWQKLFDEGYLEGATGIPFTRNSFGTFPDGLECSLGIHKQTRDTIVIGKTSWHGTMGYCTTYTVNYAWGKWEIADDIVSPPLFICRD